MKPGRDVHRHIARLERQEREQDEREREEFKQEQRARETRYQIKENTDDE